MDAVANSMYGDPHRTVAAAAAAGLQPGSLMSHMNHVGSAHNAAMYAAHAQTPSNHVGANHVMGSVPDVHKRDKDLIYG